MPVSRYIAISSLLILMLSQLAWAQSSEPEIIAPPMEFVRNVGQWDKSVEYGLLVSGGAAMLTREGITLFSKSTSLATAAEIPGEAPERGGGPYYDVRRISFAGTSKSMRMYAIDTTEALSHFYRGSDPGKWHEHVSNHRRIRYENIWPGVDATLENTAHGPRMEFTVEAGVPLDRIRLKLKGIADTNALSAGVRYQRQQEARWQRISFRYNNEGEYYPGIAADSVTQKVMITLELGTYLGGSGLEQPISLTITDSGQICVVGVTNSVDYPLANEWRGQIAGGYDRYVSKLSCDGQQFIFSSYLGGSGVEDIGVLYRLGTSYSSWLGSNRFLKANGSSLYTTGTTESSDFPTTGNAIQPARASDSTAYLMRIDGDGTLSYSSFLGGPGLFAPRGLDIGSDGSVVLVGGVLRDRMWFVTPGSVQSELNHTTYMGALGAAVVKLSPDLNSVRFGSYLFSPNGENEALDLPAHTIHELRDGHRGNSFLHIDDDGNIIVTGSLHNESAELVPLVSPLPQEQLGYLYVTKISVDGNKYIYSTRFGGLDGAPIALATFVDSNGSLHVAGRCESTYRPQVNHFDYPVTPYYATDYYTVFSETGNVLMSSLCYANGSSGSSGRTYAIPDIRGNPLLFSHGADILPPAREDDPGPRGVCGSYYCLGLDASTYKPRFASWLRHPNYIPTRGVWMGRNGSFYSLSEAPERSQRFDDSCYAYEMLNAIQPIHRGGDLDAVISRFRIEGAGSAFDCRLELPDSVRISRPRGFTDPEEFDITVEVENMADDAKRLWYIDLELPPRLELAGTGQSMRVQLTPEIFAPGMRHRHTWHVRVRKTGALEDAVVRVRTYYGGLELPKDCPPGYGDCARTLPLRFYDDIVPEMLCTLTAPDSLALENDRLTPNPFPATYTLQNLGPDIARIATLTLTGGGGMGVRAVAAATQPGRELSVNESDAANWQVEAERRPYARDVLVRVTADDVWGYPLSVCQRTLHIPAAEVYCRTGGDTVATYYVVSGMLRPDSVVAQLEIENPSDTARRILSARCDLSQAPLLRLRPGGSVDQGMLILPARGRKSYAWSFELTSVPERDTTQTVVLRYQTAIDSSWHACEWTLRLRLVDASVVCAITAEDSVRAQDLIGGPVLPLVYTLTNIGTVTVEVDHYALALSPVPGSSVAGLASLDPLLHPGGSIAAGNATQVTWRLRADILRTTRIAECTVTAYGRDDSVLSVCTHEMHIEGLDDGLTCLLTGADTVHFDRTQLRYVPDTLALALTLENLLDSEETGIETELDLTGAPRLELDPSESTGKTLAFIDSHATAALTWLLIPQPSPIAQSQEIVIRYRSDEQTEWKECRTTVFIEAWPEEISVTCATGGHDSLYADGHYERFIPDPLHVSYTVTNTGTVALTGGEASIVLPAEFMLAGSDSTQVFTSPAYGNQSGGPVSPGTLLPGASCTRWWMITPTSALTRLDPLRIGWLWTNDQQGTTDGCGDTISISPDSPASIVLTPRHLRFEAERGGPLPAAQPLQLWTGGGLAMPWTSQSSAWWLAAQPASGSQSAQVLVQPTSTQLDVGSHATELTFAATPASRSVAVTYVIRKSTGIEEPVSPDGSALDAWPQPVSVSGMLHVRVESAGENERISLIDVLGRERISINPGESGSVTIDLAPLQLSPGMYILRMTSHTGIRQRRIVIAR